MWRRAEPVLMKRYLDASWGLQASGPRCPRLSIPSKPKTKRRCLALLEAGAGQGDEVSPSQLAYLTDRIRVLEGRSQLYGTQHDWDDDGVSRRCSSMIPDTSTNAGRVRGCRRLST